MNKRCQFRKYERCNPRKLKEVICSSHHFVITHGGELYLLNLFLDSANNFLPYMNSSYIMHTFMFNYNNNNILRSMLKHSRGTTNYPPSVTVKMAITAVALHNGQKETRFPLLISLGFTWYQIFIKVSISIYTSTYLSHCQCNI